jgi:tellurite resistance protein TerC
LLVVELSDVIFAVDSIPAIFSVTKDPEIVFFSNIFAILGLRSLFFLLSNVINMFHYLKTGLSVLLILIGLKMLFENWLKELGFGTVESLIMIVSVLGLSIIASLIFPEKGEKQN